MQVVGRCDLWEYSPAILRAHRSNHVPAYVREDVSERCSSCLHLRATPADHRALQTRSASPWRPMRSSTIGTAGSRLTTATSSPLISALSKGDANVVSDTSQAVVL